MPIEIENNYAYISLNDLVQLRRDGYSVLKSPHVGNQHPSNLVCAALGIPLEMVSFTQGSRDVNFHPHMRIKDGRAASLYEPNCWTPFAALPCGTSAVDAHQASVKRVFPAVDICTDIERMHTERELAEKVLVSTNATIKQLWYRKVDACGVVQSVQNVERLSDADIESSVFQFTNGGEGWIIPNRVHILFDLAYQALSSGKDTIYHLSGPQMVGYIGRIKNSLDMGYAAMRTCIPELPETLTVRIVPVSMCRFVTTQSRKHSLSVVQETVSWYEQLPKEKRKDALMRFGEVACQYPEYIEPITTGTFLSQYDLQTKNDLCIDPWMCSVPLFRVQALHTNFVRGAQAYARARTA